MTRSRARGFLAALFVGSFGWLLFAAPAGATLPDNRAWEQVSPVDKNGADIGIAFATPETGVPVSPSGDRIVYLSFTPFGDAPNGLLTLYFRADRTASGWTSHNINYPLPSAPHVIDAEIPGQFTTDLSSSVFTTPFPYDAGDTDAAPASTGHYDQYLFGGLAPVWLSHGSQGGDATVDTVFGGASADLSHFVFESGEPIEPAAGPLLTGFNQYYLYERSGGRTELVNVDDSGTLLDPNGAVLGNGSSFGFGAPANNSGTTKNAVSSDGSKVFFETPPPGYGTVQVYMRDTADDKTKHVSAPDAGVMDPNGTQDAFFAGAAGDGSKVFFTTTQQLTADDQNTTNDVYEYDTATGTRTRVSHGASGTADADVLGVVLASDDGSTVYFVASHQLVGTEGTDGAPNLYRYDTVHNETTFVATLAGGDQTPVWDGNDVDREAYATANGGVLAFTSRANLTPPYDSQGHAEVFVYHAGESSIECASCRPDGTPPTGDADFGPNPVFRNAFFIYGFPLPLTADGSRVFFQTADSVIPEDANGDAPTLLSNIPGSSDVYEYSDGKVGLISDGHSTDGSFLAGASPSGNDVFFYTRAALVPQDVDGGSYDIYDARVGGGFPTPPGTAPCQDDGCHAQPTTAPFLPIPSSTSALPDESVLPAPTFTVRSISRSAAARAARSGRLTLTVHVTASGRTVARAFATLGHHKRRVGSASRTFSRASTAHVTLRLSKAARARLRAHRRLALRIEVTYSRGNLKRVAHVTLRRSSR